MSGDVSYIVTSMRPRGGLIYSKLWSSHSFAELRLCTMMEVCLCVRVCGYGSTCSHELWFYRAAMMGQRHVYSVGLLAIYIYICVCMHVLLLCHDALYM